MFLGNRYGSGTGPILFENLECLGNETSLFECEHYRPGRTCTHNEDVSIVCDDGSGECSLLLLSCSLI